MKKILLFITFVFSIYALKAQDSKIENYRLQLDEQRLEMLTKNIEGLVDKEDVITERTESSLSFNISEGKKVDIIAAGPMNYLENSEWKLIHNEFIPYSQLQNYKYSSPFNDNKLYVGNAENTILLTTKENENFTFGRERSLKMINQGVEILEARALRNAVFEFVEHKGNPSFIYTELFQGIDSRYERKTDGFKQDYIINNPSVVSQNFTELKFSEKIQIPVNYFIEKELNGEVENLVVVSKDRTKYLKFSPILIYDNSNVETYGTYEVNDLGNNLFEISYVIKADWLKDLTRTFPIVVDPSLTINTTNSDWWTGTVDEDGSISNYCTSDELLVGINTGGVNSDFFHATVKFNVASIPDNACVYNASLNMYQNNFKNQRNDDDDLKFTIGSSTADLEDESCPNTYTAIQAGTKFEAWDVFDNGGVGPSGSNGYNDYNESNGWKTFLNYGTNTTIEDYDTYIQSAVTSVSNNLIFGLDYYSEGHTDIGYGAHCPECGTDYFLGGCISFCDPDNDEWLAFSGHSSAQKPYVTIYYDLPITIATQPTPDTKCAGESVSFSTVAAGGGDYNYQWQFNNVDISGANASSYTISSVAANNAGNYRCVVSNMCLVNVNTNNVALTVNSASNKVILVNGTTASGAVEQCTEGDGWTYYATTANPDDYIFGIKKNTNNFNCVVDVVDKNSNTSITSVNGTARGTFLMGRYVNVTNNGPDTDFSANTVSVRFFVNDSERTQALSEANTFLTTALSGSAVTPFTMFKTPTGQDFDPATNINGGNFNFTPTNTWTPAAVSGSLNGVDYYELTGITGFSGFGGGYSVNDGGSPLPVELLDFTAKSIENKSVALNWSTATEINNQGFEVQRSTNGIDFEKIGFVTGNGNSNILNHYSYQDREVSTGTYYYRLKQLDFDAAFEYSDIRNASILATEKFSVSNFIPNPSSDQTTLVFESNEASTVQIEILDNLGRSVALKEIQLEEGRQSIPFNLKAYAVGVYTAKILMNKEEFTRKLVVRK